MSKDECQKMRSECSGKTLTSKLELALYGEDGTGGIVKDIHDIKSQLGSYSGTVKQVFVPIIVAVVVALIVRFI